LKHDEDEVRPELIMLFARDDGGGIARRSESRAQTRNLKHDEVRPELIML
jgi:hypothetical protein